MELPLHVVTDDYGGQGWVVRIVDNKAVIQFEAIVGPNEDHAVIAARAEKIAKAVNCHDDLLATLTIVLSEIRSANGYPHFTEEHIDLIQRPITEAKSIAKAGKQ